MAHGTPSNFIRQTVGSSVGTTDPETIDVQDASAFPDPSTSQYDIVIWDAGTHNRPDQDPDVEVLTVTGRDTTNETLTVTRGSQGTTNVSHPNTSDVIVAPLSQADFNSVNAANVTATTTTVTEVGTQAHNTSTQTISTGTTTTVVLGTTTDDNLNAADLANNQIVIQDAGDYLLFGQVFYQSDSAPGSTAAWTTGDTAGARVHVNGSLVGGGGQQKLGSGAQRIFSNPTYRTLSANDTVDLRTFQNSGGDQVLGSGDNFCALSVVKVG